LKLTNQVGVDLGTFLYTVSVLVFLGILAWFFATLRRIQRTLEEIKRKLDSSATPETEPRGS